MITELCRADLFDLVSEKGAIKDRQLFKALAKQICIALLATKNAGYAHLDIKLENILIAQDGSLRLCDFGFAARTNSFCTKNCGTVGYRAPETIDPYSSSYDGAKADIFSLGVVLYTLYFGAPPFAIARVD